MEELLTITIHSDKVKKNDILIMGAGHFIITRTTKLVDGGKKILVAPYVMVDSGRIFDVIMSNNRDFLIIRPQKKKKD